jgi:hypothetical protein
VIVGERFPDGLPDARTRQNRNSNRQPPPYLRVRRCVDKEDFTLNSVPLGVRGGGAGRSRSAGMPEFAVLLRVSPLRNPARELSPVKHKDTNIVQAGKAALRCLGMPARCGAFRRRLGAGKDLARIERSPEYHQQFFVAVGYGTERLSFSGETEQISATDPARAPS